MPNYLEILAVAYPGIGASTNGDPSVYANLSWDSTVISQQDLDTASSSIADIQEIGTPTGFPNTRLSSISYNQSTRTFTITPTLSSFYFFIQGIKYIKVSSCSVVWSNTEGVHIFYFDTTGTLISSQTPPESFDEVTLVAYLYWDATNSSVIIFGDERHRTEMSAATHNYLHETEGTRYVSGFASGNYTTTGSGSNDVDCMISIADGVIRDEDIRIVVEHNSSPTLQWNQFLAGTISGLTGTPSSSTAAKIPVYYRSGSGDAWRKHAAGNAPVYKATNRLYYNQYTGGSWQLTEVSEGYFTVIWIYATNNENEPIIAIMGQNQYNNETDAKVNFVESSISFGNLPFREMKCIYRLIYKTSSTYTNSFGAKLVNISDLRNSLFISGRDIPITLSSLGVIDGLMRNGDYATKLELNETCTRQAPNQSASSGTVTLNYSLGDFFKVTASGNISIALSNLVSGKVCSLTLLCVNFGAYTITWPSGTKWAGGIAPALTTSGVDALSFMKDGADNIYGFLLARDIQ
jgi:hypothetical protein